MVISKFTKNELTLIKGLIFGIIIPMIYQKLFPVMISRYYSKRETPVVIPEKEKWLNEYESLFMRTLDYLLFFLYSYDYWSVLTKRKLHARLKKVRFFGHRFMAFSF